MTFDIIDIILISVSAGCLIVALVIKCILAYADRHDKKNHKKGKDIQ